MQASDKVVTFDDKEKNQAGFMMLMNEKQEEEFNQAMLDALQERIYNEMKNM